MNHVPKFYTITDAKTYLQNAGVGDWNFGKLAYMELEPELVAFFWRRSTGDQTFKKLMSDFITIMLGQNPADYF